MVTLISANKATYYDEVISKCEMTRKIAKHVRRNKAQSMPSKYRIRSYFSHNVKITFYNMLYHSNYSHVIKIQIFIY